MKIWLTGLIWIAMGVDAFCQSSYSFQYNGSSYTSYEDVTIENGYASRCFGNILEAYWGGYRPILKFENLNVPEGEYRFDLQFRVSSVPRAGYVQFYFLKKTNWSDPHADLNPCPPSGLYPTYQYVRYASEAWQMQGATGSSEQGAYLGQATVNSNGLYTVSGGNKKVTINPEQNVLGFLFISTTADIYIYCRETSGSNYALNPKLILYPIKKQGGGLDFNPVFRPLQPLAPLRE